MQAPREIELKLECEAVELPTLSAHPLLQSDAPADPVVLETTYFDTPERALREAGLSLRLRRSGERIVQTLKAASASAGLFDRPEWEWEVPGPQPERAVLEGTPAAKILPREAGPALEPLFTAMVQRTERPVRHGASDIVVTLDAGRIETDGSDTAICEIELELKSGSPADLFDLARALGESVPLRLGALSKGERGDALRDETLRRPRKAETPVFDPGVDTGEAFVRIAQGCLRQYAINEGVFLHGQDPEALHQMRVALRRLRSAFSLFKPMLASDAQAEALRQQLKSAIAPFGAARNLDVFLSETLASELARRPDEASLEVLRERLEADRARAYAEALDVLRGVAWRSLLIDLVAWLETGDWRRADGVPHRDRPAEDFAAEVLDRLRRRMKRRGRQLAELSPEERHQVRIVAKKLRYGAEFFGLLFPEKKARKRHKAFTSALSDLQDHLGALNDLATAHEIAAGLIEPGQGGDAPGAAIFAAGLTAADGEARTGKLLKAAASAHEDLIEVRCFWR